MSCQVRPKQWHTSTEILQVHRGRILNVMEHPVARCIVPVEHRVTIDVCKGRGTCFRQNKI